MSLLQMLAFYKVKYFLLNFFVRVYLLCFSEFIVTLSMLNPDISCFENSEDPDQVALQKPPDQDPHSSALLVNAC